VKVQRVLFLAMVMTNVVMVMTMKATIPQAAAAAPPAAALGHGGGGGGSGSNCERQVQVQSNRQATITASLANLNLQVDSTNATASSALSSAEAVASAVFTALSTGYNATQLQVTSLYVFGNPGSYEAYISLSVDVPIGKAAAAIARSLDLGATLSYLQFGLSSAEAGSVEQAALGAAIADAKSQASFVLSAMHLYRRATCAVTTSVSVSGVIAPPSSPQSQLKHSLQLPQQQMRALTFLSSQVTAFASATLTITFDDCCVRCFVLPSDWFPPSLPPPRRCAIRQFFNSFVSKGQRNFTLSRRV